VDGREQPCGAQERHDYQPINIDFTFSDFSRTRRQNERILHEFGKRAGMEPSEVDGLFKGEGFDRLILAGGGVPRDFLSLLLEGLQIVQDSGDGRIGKDDVRQLSRPNLERRIEELKHDSEGDEQSLLIRGIYALRAFCVHERKTNVLLVSEQMMQQEDPIRRLIYRLLDYRILHLAGSALTSKSQTGATFQAFAIDIGCYAHMRKLDGRLNEIDLAGMDAKEKMRSAPVLELELLQKLWDQAPKDPKVAEEAMLAEREDAA
jgi:hypothetical protein